MYRPKIFTISQVPVRFNTLQATFVKLVNAHLGAWGISTDTRDRINVQAALWDNAYALVANDQTDNPVNRAAMDAVMTSFSALIDSVVHSSVIGNSAVAPEDEAALGIHEVNTSRTPVPEISTVPILALDNREPAAIHVQFHDSRTPTSIARPVEASFLEIRYQIGGTAPDAPSETMTRATVTRFGGKIALRDEDREKKMYAFGRWGADDGTVGQWSAIASAIII